jgi:hypothetical protein
MGGILREEALLSQDHANIHLNKERLQNIIKNAMKKTELTECDIKGIQYIHQGLNCMLKKCMESLVDISRTRQTMTGIFPHEKPHIGSVLKL